MSFEIFVSQKYPLFDEDAPKQFLVPTGPAVTKQYVDEQLSHPTRDSLADRKLIEREVQELRALINKHDADEVIKEQKDTFKEAVKAYGDSDIDKDAQGLLLKLKANRAQSLAAAEATNSAIISVEKWWKIMQDEGDAWTSYQDVDTFLDHVETEFSKQFTGGKGGYVRFQSRNEVGADKVFRLLNDINLDYNLKHNPSHADDDWSAGNSDYSLYHTKGFFVIKLPQVSYGV